MHSQDIFVFDSCLLFSLGSIALFLLLDEFLNFSGVHSSSRVQATIFDLARLDHSLNLGLDVAICQVLLIKKKLGVLSPQRGIVQRRSG